MVLVLLNVIMVQEVKTLRDFLCRRQYLGVPGYTLKHGRIDPPKAGRGHATLVHPVYYIEGEMLAFTQNLTRYDVNHAL